MLNTHPNFKSIDPEIKDAQSINICIGKAIAHQHKFYVETTSFEKAFWRENKEFENFKIDLEKIDRLYYITHNLYESDTDYFEIACRMIYNNNFVFVHLWAYLFVYGFNFIEWRGSILVSLTANFLLEINLFNDTYPRELIYQFLVEDGIEINDGIRSKILWCSAPSLKYLCHETIYENKDSLAQYLQLLPSMIKNSLVEFIKFKEAKEDEL